MAPVADVIISGFFLIAPEIMKVISAFFVFDSASKNYNGAKERV